MLGGRSGMGLPDAADAARRFLAKWRQPSSDGASITDRIVSTACDAPGAPVRPAHSNAAAIICTLAVILAAAPPVPQGRPHDGSGASVGPARPVWNCRDAQPCPSARDPLLMPPSLPPVRSHGVEHHAALPPEIAIPAPPGALLFVPCVLALLWIRRTPQSSGRAPELARRSPRVSSPNLRPARGSSRRPLFRSTRT
ncbi:MAG: hypothetical protein K2X74_00625 [Acetobacteraceae bacterium]|nr:hypothetical protein [Acetobacteraceae bacterium]